MMLEMHDAEFEGDGPDWIERPAPVPGKVRIVVEGSPSEPLIFKTLASLVLGGTLEGSAQLARRLQVWQQETDQRGAALYSEAPDESEGERLRYALIGLMSRTPELSERFLGAGLDAADAAFVLFSEWLDPLTHSRLMQPLQRRYDELATRGESIFEGWIDSGRRAEQQSRALARQAAFDSTDEAIDEMVGLLAEKPAVRELVTQQSIGMLDQVVAVVRQRSAAADTFWERRVRGFFHLR